MGNKDKDKFLALARRRFAQIEVAELDIRAASLEDLKFAYNVEDGQWPESIRNERISEGRPCLTSNKLGIYVAHVANRERDQRLAGKVRPVDDNADVKTAKVIEGLIRQIEYASKADEIYADVGEKAIAGGFGYWRIITKEKDDSFEQEVFIEKIDNQFSVYLDPRGNYAFIRKSISKEEFEDRYPGKTVASFDQTVAGEEYSQWYEEDRVFIAEYFYKERYDKTIAECMNLVTGEIKIVELKEEMTSESLIETGYQVLRQKTKKANKIKWAKINGYEVLEEGDWVGKNIPIIEVVGDKVNIGGKEYKRSLIRDAKSPQQMYNYFLTHMTETMALVPKSPYIVTPQEIKGFESMWNVANVKNYPYLMFNPQGNRVPKRELPPQIQTGAGQLLQIAAADIQDTIGMYEASFGEKSNERTGIAIKMRAGRSDFGTYHFSDNFRRAILETVRHLIDIIPKVYDTQRVIRILGEDGAGEELVEINKEMIIPLTGQKRIINDLTVGKYDVVADVKMWSTRRQESAELMANIMQASPNIAPLILDLVFKYNDFPGASEVEKRIKEHMSQLLGGKPGKGIEQEQSPVGEQNVPREGEGEL